jgi:hypothetical protein
MKLMKALKINFKFNGIFVKKEKVKKIISLFLNKF